MAIFSKLRKQEPIMDLDELHVALKAYASGDYSIRLNAEVPGVAGEIARSYNQMCHITSTATQEMLVVLKDVAESGIIDARVTSTRLEGARGAVMRGLNNVLEELVAPLDEMVQVITALSHGDLTRNLSPVVNGRKKEGQFLIWTNMVNEMLAQLSNVAAEVSRVAKEVGSEGKLGGYAKVPNATGVWKELTDNVNMLAESVTDRVRAISEVATAVAGGDLSRTLDVEAQGEVLVLKKSINGMIQNLQTTTKTNAEQDWLKGNLARVARLLQGHHDLTQVANIVLSDLSPLLEVLHATFYHLDDSDLGESKLKLLASYAVADESRLSATWKVGQGLVGQCAAEKTRIFVESIPDDYINITSALGNSRPKSLVLLPILFEGKIKGVIELASFKIFEQVQDNFLNQVTEHIGIVINTIEATLRTEVLLAQSQSMTDELQSQQEELRATNQELEEKAPTLGGTKT
ncbi:MAG: GAF domain-containing protein, partial [Actinomycetota bacterium]